MLGSFQHCERAKYLRSARRSPTSWKSTPSEASPSWAFVDGISISFLCCTRGWRSTTTAPSRRPSVRCQTATNLLLTDYYGWTFIFRIFLVKPLHRIRGWKEWIQLNGLVWSANSRAQPAAHRSKLRALAWPNFCFPELINLTLSCAKSVLHFTLSVRNKSSLDGKVIVKAEDDYVNMIYSE